MQDKPAVLFVCLGNICRSPLAEAAFRHQSAAAGLEIEVDSAGTGDWHIGKPPDRRAQAVARKYGVDISGYRARQVNRADFVRFSHIVAMDADNLTHLQMLQPDATRANLSLLLDHVEGHTGRAVADPYFGNAAGFETTWAEVSRGAAALAKKLAVWTPSD